MKIGHQQLVRMLKKVDYVREQLAVTCVGKPEPALRIMDLHYVIEQAYGLSIEMKEVSFQATYLKGHVLRFNDGRATIMVRANLSEPDKRIVAIKELCHLFLDEEDDWSTNGTEIIDSLLEESVIWLEDGIGIPDPTTPLQSEMLAVLAASVLAYPTEYRANDREKLDRDETTVGAIALQHDVPPYVIEHAFRHEELLGRIREKIDQNEQAAAE